MHGLRDISYIHLVRRIAGTWHMQIRAAIRCLDPFTPGMARQQSGPTSAKCSAATVMLLSSKHTGGRQSCCRLSREAHKGSQLLGLRPHCRPWSLLPKSLLILLPCSIAVTPVTPRDVLGDQGEGPSRSAGPGGPAHPVHVVLAVAGHVVVDHAVHAGDVQAPAGHICAGAAIFRV